MLVLHAVREGLPDRRSDGRHSVFVALNHKLSVQKSINGSNNMTLQKKLLGIFLAALAVGGTSAAQRGNHSRGDRHAGHDDQLRDRRLC
jgi:hypothetical protein